MRTKSCRLPGSPSFECQTSLGLRLQQTDRPSPHSQCSRQRYSRPQNCGAKEGLAIRRGGRTSGRRAAPSVHLEIGGLKEFPNKAVSGLILTEQSCFAARLVESFVILNAVGGECVDDFERLRQDPGLEEIIGHELPSPTAARQFLNAFHEEEKIEEAKQ